MAPNMQAPAIFDDASRLPPKPSVFKAILSSSKAHRRNNSADDAFSSKASHKSQPSESSFVSPIDQAYAALSQQQPLAEIAPNRDGTSPSAPQKKGGLHKKTKSAVSLKSLRNYMERKDQKPEGSYADDSAELKPKKAKSANSLSAILKRSQRGRKADDSKGGRDKENRSPTDLVDSMPSPLWGPYVPEPFQDQHATPYSHNRRRTLQEEVSLYTPKGYGPEQQRNFYDYHQPSLTNRTEAKARPKSDIFSGNRKVKDFFGPLQNISLERLSIVDQSDTSSSRMRGRSRGLSRPEPQPQPEQKAEQSPKRQSRVQAAISAFNAKEKEAELHKKLNSKELESEFEKLLDARNIPHNMRDKMRSLDTNIKADFIQKDRAESGTPHSAGAASVSANDSTGRRGRRSDQKDDQQSHDGKGSRSRSRSRGFTFSKRNSASPTKKQRPESGIYRRPKSADLSQPAGLSKILTPSTSTTSLSATACRDTAADPSDFVHYLREIQKPEMMEVGKMHKLRLLLRNETVGWVDTFISDGGMDEIVQLIYRIMKVEWREEHEDNLLHETLLCLKALCTTSIALQHLTAIEAELFPALLKMLFDEEKKGPSEYTTRSIIVNLLFTQLSEASSTRDAASRANRILSYLRDPSPPEENQPLTFIANIYQSRPYRVWCKEVTNVTKEVFWIFLHHLNVIPIAKSELSPSESFRDRHFPAPRPPVPAAPYVGGVEWDATNYLAAHLDLLNGLVASLPTSEERNQLRMELRASGFEKVMGGSLRTCKEKFYGSVHDCLRTWIASAVEDNWPYLAVREGPPRAEPGSPTKSPIKACGSPRKGLLDEKPPRLELALDVPANKRVSQRSEDIGNWL